MGSSESKEEVVIAQTASGSATLNNLTITDGLLIVLLVISVGMIVYFAYKKCADKLKRNIRREINVHELQRVVSVPSVAT